jgi:excisionase family DNA binding protein
MVNAQEMVSLVQTATVTVGQAAKILGIGRQTAYNLAKKGELPGCRRLGKRYVISKAALCEYLENV